MGHRGFVSLVLLLCIVGCGGGGESGTPNACPAPEATGATELAPGQRQFLHDGWAIRSSAEVPTSGSKLSTACFAPDGWTDARVPSTVVGAEVDAGEFPDPFMDRKLRDLPGMKYIQGLDFGNFPTPEDSPYKPSWWYRTEFDLAPAPAGRDRTWLRFDGIDYRANVWLNGKRIAKDSEVVGMYRRFDFDVTGIARPGKKNVLAVEVTGPDGADLAHSFMDHAPMPPDKSMGIWREVSLSATGAVAIQHLAVTSDLALPALDNAKLSVLLDLSNETGKEQSGTLSGIVGDVAITEPVTLAAHETRSIALDPSTHPELSLSNPKLWWPHQLGPQNLYTAALDFSIDGAISDHAESTFGIRRIDSEMVDGKWVKFSVNGKPMLVRGAGYEHELFFRWDDQRDENDIRLVKDMGLNTIRLEGGLGSDHLYDVADREGVLIIDGWQCCNAWEHWGVWTDESRPVAKASLETQMMRLRGHPSLLTWWNGSDHLPPTDVEQMYDDVIAASGWPNPVQSSAGNDVSTLTGPSGVKMNGPYDYEPPVYWYVDKKYGGAWGFNGETGPGPAVPCKQSLQRFLSPSALWPKGDGWAYHAGGVPFDNLNAFDDAMNGRYGTPSDLDDYLKKADALEYDGERAMFEAYRKNQFQATGVVQWMLNNAWPSVIWHLYDYYFSTGGGYYGAKQANQPLHIQYSFDDQSVVIVNDLHQDFPGMQASVSVYDFSLAETFSKQQAVDVAADSNTTLLTIPDQSGITTTYFVKLSLADAQGTVVSDNFYWLSTKPDVLDFANTVFAKTPTTQHADLTLLSGLPAATLGLSATSEDAGDAKKIHVHVDNTSSALAFMIALRVDKGAGGDEALPSTFSDDYFSLLPGESRDVTAELATSALGGAAPVIAVSGYNVAPTTVTP